MNEIEYENNEDLDEILSLLNLGGHKIVSKNTQDLYREIGIDVLNMRELKLIE